MSKPEITFAEMTKLPKYAKVHRIAEKRAVSIMAHCSESLTMLEMLEFAYLLAILDQGNAARKGKIRRPR